MSPSHKPVSAGKTREAIDKANPRTAECLFHSRDIERKIMRLIDPKHEHGPNNSKYEEIRLWLWCLYRRGRLDYMREASHDDTPGSRGEKDAESDATGFYS